MKLCRTCGEEQPLEAFCLNRSGTGGHAERRHSQCRACHKARYERRKLIKAGLLSPWQQVDILDLLAAEDARLARRKEVVRRSYEKKGREYQRAYKAAQAERLKARNAAYYRQNKEQHVAYARQWRAANPERVRELVSQWRTANREVYLISQRLSVARRRAAIEATSIGPITAEALMARFALFGGLCWICRTAPWEAIDHVKPLSKGGPHILANMRPACKPCNSRKKDRWPIPPEVFRLSA